MGKINNPQSVEEWINELHRVSVIRDPKRAQAHENTLRRFREWLDAHPEVPTPPIMKNLR